MTDEEYRRLKSKLEPEWLIETKARLAREKREQKLARLQAFLDAEDAARSRWKRRNAWFGERLARDREPEALSGGMVNGSERLG